MCGIDAAAVPLGCGRQVLRPKLEFLREKGFSCADVLTTPYVLKLGVDSLRAVYDALQADAIDDVSLRLISTFYERRVVSSRRLPRRVLARVLECRAASIAKVPPDLAVRPTASPREQYSTYIQNLERDEELYQLPGWAKNSSYYSAPVGDRTHHGLLHCIISTWPRRQLYVYLLI